MRNSVHRLQVLLIAITLSFVLLTLRLINIQLWSGPLLRARAVRQQGYELVLELPRGGIYDRNHSSLTASTCQPILALFPNLIEDKISTARELALFLDLNPEDVLNKINIAQPFYYPVTRQVPALTVFEAGSFPGVFLLQKQERYGANSLARHLIGYVRAEENMGVTGLEQHFNSFLRQGAGLSLVAWVDANKKLIPGLGFQQQVLGRMDGGQLVLTLDAHIQRIVEEVMDQHCEAGAAVVVQVETGELLAVASRPNFTQNRVEAYLDKTDACLMNRAFLSYPPGSLFKIVVAAAALDEGVTDTEEEFLCEGFIQIGHQVYRCHQYEKGGHGPLTLTGAFAHSCNPVFITLAQRLGAERLLNYARRLGLGSTIALIPENKAGYIPGSAPFLGDLANISLGQGSVLVTPLQMAQVTQIVANNGVFVPLWVVKKGPDGEMDPGDSKILLSSETAQKLQFLLQETVVTGTGSLAAVPWLTLGGKTGTAETGRKDAEGKAVAHAWFAGFGPLEKPLLAVVIMVEEGGSGGEVAAPIFREIITRIYQEVSLQDLDVS
ncbi:MAG: peptidoglycan D,D-transpeptidase FtsI family protein [bacterium]